MLWLFINVNSLLMWTVGTVLGLVFIWVAVTFESKRSQITQRLEAQTAALATWGLARNLQIDVTIAIHLLFRVFVAFHRSICEK